MVENEGRFGTTWWKGRFGTTWSKGRFGTTWWRRSGELVSRGRGGVVISLALLTDTIPLHHCIQNYQSIYPERLTVVDVPRPQTESGQIAPTSPCAPSYSALAAHPGDCFGTQGNQQFIALTGERACSARQAEAKQ